MRFVQTKRGASRRAAGFSLLEMLAVIVLIGIVAGIVAARIGPSFDSGKTKAGKAQLDKLAAVIDRYTLDQGALPQKLDDLVAKPSTAKQWNGAYAKPSDLVDPYGHAFVYRAPGEHGDYDLVFLGKDGKPGGENFDTDFGNWH
ncbi:type II secretion system major pseudopilin GspG [Tahibacter soli]|uniref:Type II secretion system core protein G n=1 Tax=Tahibacter soli TaxID=2983605 RepID=A0A9X4BM41_9GAMM|nr:type II secretion system major pseudopilin GspG [Tahibacter soli]MDC8014924.1 type II secretion system major pseudopilin GspG [Tahibacter soli]